LVDDDDDDHPAEFLDTHHTLCVCVCVTLPLFNCARDLKSSKRFVRVAVEEYGCLFVVADCESAGGEEREE
jgi:hypothetical protein